MSSSKNQYPSSSTFQYPHLGMRKIKSILAIFIGFCIWQIIRIFLPELEVHPIFIYVYGMIEIRETSDKTSDYGKLRIMATFAAIAIGLPFMAMLDYGETIIDRKWHLFYEIFLLLLGALLVLYLAEMTKCRIYCGLAAAIYIILMVTHMDTSMYLYSIMRAIQTIIGVTIAWLLNVKLLPYPPEPGSLSYYLREKRKNIRNQITTKKTDNQSTDDEVEK